MFWTYVVEFWPIWRPILKFVYHRDGDAMTFEILRTYVWLILVRWHLHDLYTFKLYQKLSQKVRWVLHLLSQWRRFWLWLVRPPRPVTMDLSTYTNTEYRRICRQLVMCMVAYSHLSGRDPLVVPSVHTCGLNTALQTKTWIADRKWGNLLVESPHSHQMIPVSFHKQQTWKGKGRCLSVLCPVCHCERQNDRLKARWVYRPILQSGEKKRI